MSNSTLPKDPLAALGASIFVNILEFLPCSTLAIILTVNKSWNRHSNEHKSGIWRSACYRAGISQAKIDTFIQARKAAEQGAEEPQVVDWKKLCKEYITEDNNWRYGRCKEDWIYNEFNDIWRFKIDEEQKMCIMTSIIGGLEVVDLASETQKEVFAIPEVQNYAHLEFCKGYVIFDVPGNQLCLEVYRTQHAISRSPNKWTPRQPLPQVAASSISAVDPSWEPKSVIVPNSHFDQSANPPPTLPRGALAFYRQIIPPTECHAFRARLDGEGTDNERAMLGAAGEEAIYIWDLDNTELSPEVIPMSTGEGVSYIEFDDQYVFICKSERLEIYSRQTKTLWLAFPPPQSTIQSFCAAAYYLDLSDERELEPLWEGPGVDHDIDPMSEYDYEKGVSSWVGRADLRGRRSDAEGFAQMMYMTDPPEGAEEEGWLWPPRHYNFRACHLTEHDLICATTFGHLLIVRNYASILSIPNIAERNQKWGQHTIVIALEEPIQHLAVQGTRITASLETHIIFFDTSTFPNLPLPLMPANIDLDMYSTHIRIHSILSANPAALKATSCAQISGSTIYYAFPSWVSESSTAEKLRARAYVHEIPERARYDRYRCIRSYDFAK